MAELDFCELSIEQEEYLVELLCTAGACALDLFARELDELCRQNVDARPPCDQAQPPGRALGGR